MLLGLLIVALWAHLPYLIIEHRRIEPWKWVGLLSGDLMALGWFLRFVFDHAIVARPFISISIRDGRKHFRIAACGGLTAIIIDLAFAFQLMATERHGYQQAHVTEAQVVTIKKHWRPAATWYEVECSFSDEAGRRHDAHLRVEAEQHILPSQLSARAVAVLTATDPTVDSIPIRYDQAHPSRAWIDGSGWEDDNRFYWFSLLTLLFQTIVTALFLLLFLPYTRGNLLPWWWDTYKVLPLMVQVFWMLLLGLTDRFMN